MSSFFYRFFVMLLFYSLKLLGIPTKTTTYFLQLLIVQRKRAADSQPQSAVPAKLAKKSPYQPYSPDAVQPAAAVPVPTSVKTSLPPSSKVPYLDEVLKPGFRIRIFFLRIRIRIRAKIFMRIRIRILGLSGGGGWW